VLWEDQGNWSRILKIVIYILQFIFVSSNGGILRMGRLENYEKYQGFNDILGGGGERIGFTQSSIVN